MQAITKKHLVALGLAGAALALAVTPSAAAKKRHHRTEAGMMQAAGPGPYASEEGYVSGNAAGYKGMRGPGGCWVETDLGRGFGFWGSCGEQGRALGEATGQWRTRNYATAPR